MSPALPHAGTDACHALETLLGTLRREERFAVALIWFLDAQSESLFCAVGAAGEREDDTRFLQYCMRIRMRASGTVLQRALNAGHAIWYENVSLVNDFRRNDRMREAGYGGYCCIPLRSGEQLSAVAEFFDTAPRPEDAALLDRLRTALEGATGDIIGCGRQFLALLRKDLPLHAEQQRFREKELRLLFRNAPVGIVVTDEDDYVVEYNERFREMFGFGDRDITGESFPKLLQPDNPLTQSAPYRDLREGTRRRVEIEKRYHVDDHSIDVRLHMTGLAIDGEHSRTWYCVRMIEDISEAKRLEERLRQAESQRSGEMRLFALRLQNAQEEERRRIASDLHDDLCQRLSGMKLSIEVFEDEVRHGSEAGYQRLQLLKSQLENMIGTVRRMSSSLRPSVLDDFGLLPALRVMAREQEEMHGLRIDVQAEGYASAVELREHETALYRIVQEALSNIVQHADAGEARIDLAVRDGEIVLSIQDNGIGFSPSEVRYSESDMRGMGLVSMRERAQQLHGRLRVESVPGSGTAVTVQLPHPARKEGLR